MNVLSYYQFEYLTLWDTGNCICHPSFNLLVQLLIQFNSIQFNSSQFNNNFSCIYDISTASFVHIFVGEWNIGSFIVRCMVVGIWMEIFVEDFLSRICSFFVFIYVYFFFPSNIYHIILYFFVWFLCCCVSFLVRGECELIFCRTRWRRCLTV